MSVRVPRGAWRLGVTAVVLAALGACALGPGVPSALANAVNVRPPEVLANAGDTVLECDGGDWEHVEEGGSGSAFTFQWLRDGTTIAGATEVIYRVSAADQGHSISCVVTVPYPEPVEAASYNSIAIGGHASEPLRDVTLPRVSGAESVGAVVSCSEGTWNQSASFTYQWLRSGSPIAGATNREYIVTPEDEGSSLGCEVTAKAGAEQVSVQSENKLSISVAQLEDKSPPEVVGVGEVGRKLTCEPGVWSGTPTFSYQWLENGSLIASGYEYTVEAKDRLQKIACEVVAVSRSGEHKSAKSSNELRIPGSAPENVEPPVASVKGGGEAFFEKTLICDKGTWNGVPSPTFKYQWVRDGTEALGTPTTNDEYTVASEDRGHTLDCVVYAENEVRQNVVAVSNTLGVPKGTGLGKPVDTVAPTVSPTSALAEQTVSCGSGTWNPAAEGAEPYTYQWLRDGQRIAGAQGALYKVTTADEGFSLECEVTAHNEEGSATATSSNAAVVAGSAPVNVTRPQVSGLAKVGETLVCLRGEWRGEPPPKYESHWLRGTKTIASGSSYKVEEADRGYPLSCTVTASNSAGSTEAESANSAQIPGVVPHDTTSPTISGEAKVGAKLRCDPGKWIGEPEPELSYQWAREGEPIPGAGTSEYEIEGTDKGRVLTCSVRGANHEGSETVWSQGVKIQGEKPHVVIAPQATGSGALGQTLTCVPGVWSGHPPPVLSYQWLRGGLPIASATASTYRVAPEDEGQLLSCLVTATNNEGSANEESNGIAVAVTSSQSGQVAGFKAEQPFTPTATTSAPLSLAEVVAALRKQLSRTQHNMKSHGILKWGHYTFAFAAPAAGTLKLSWYRALAKGASSKSKRKPTVVASSSTAFTAAATKLATLKLTSEGRHLLKESKSLKVTVSATFVRPAGLPATWTTTIYLNR